MNWINTDYHYKSEQVEQKIMYEKDTYIINRWDSIRGDDIIDNKHLHYKDLFLMYVLPHISKIALGDK